MKKRQVNKVVSIVKNHINSGRTDKLKRVHFKAFDKYYGSFMDKAYLNFRLWWYEQDWNTLDYTDEVNKIFTKNRADFEVLTGIDMKKYKIYFNLNHKKAKE
jgi:hypothetical protein